MSGWDDVSSKTATHPEVKDKDHLLPQGASHGQLPLPPLEADRAKASSLGLDDTASSPGHSSDWTDGPAPW